MHVFPCVWFARLNSLSPSGVITAELAARLAPFPDLQPVIRFPWVIILGFLFQVVCGFCSDCKAPLRYLMYKPARVCQECFEKLSIGRFPDLLCSMALLWLIRIFPWLFAEIEELSEESSEAMSPTTENGTPIEGGNKFSKASLKARFKGMHMGSFGKGVFGKKRPAVLQEVSYTKPLSFSGQHTYEGIVLHLRNIYLLPWMQVSANVEDAEMSGYLKMWKNKRWKKMWFVLKGKVLYTYKASEDAAADDSKVLLGYEVRVFSSVSIHHVLVLPSGLCKLALPWCLHFLHSASSVVPGHWTQPCVWAHTSRYSLFNLPHWKPSQQRQVSVHDFSSLLYPMAFPIFKSNYICAALSLSSGGSAPCGMRLYLEIVFFLWWISSIWDGGLPQHLRSIKSTPLPWQYIPVVHHTLNFWIVTFFGYFHQCAYLML